MLKKIINTCLLVGAAALFSFYHPQPGFKAAQIKSSRVKAAYAAKWPALQALLNSKHISTGSFDLYIRAFKQEGQLEAWVKNTGDKQYSLLKTWPICAASGSLGPKRQQGDGQVPEGFYEIASFNPASSYHLSLKVGYPNKSDRLKASGDPGDDIMIHGNCVTIGCIPIENEPIEELYVLCVETANRKRVIYTDIYPYRFGDKKMEQAAKNYSAETRAFWASLQKAYSYFEQNRQLPKISTGKKGDYSIETPGT